MKPDQKRVSALLVQTVSLLCKNGLHFEKGLRIQGLLGITIDDKDVFIVQIDDKLLQKNFTEEQSNAFKGKSKTDQESTSRKTCKDLPNQFLDVAPEKSTKYLDPQNRDETVTNDLMNEAVSPRDPSNTVGEDDEIVFVKSEVTEDLIENNEPSSLELMHNTIEGQTPFNDQINGIEGLEEANECRSENSFNLSHISQRRNFPQRNDFLMQQQFTNGSAMVTPPAMFDGRNFKDQSASTFNETFHHMSGAQEMIKESVRIFLLF